MADIADNSTADPGAGGDTFSTDDVAGVHYPRVKLTDGTADSTTVIAAGGGVEAGALRVTIANDSTGVVSVDDNGSTLSVDDGAGSLTVDGTVTANAGTGTFTVDQADTATADYDSGAGTVTQTMIGLALPASGGPVAGGTSSAPVRVDPTGTTIQPVSGTVTANAGTGTMAVSNAGTFATQVDGAALTALQLIDDTVFTDDAAFTVATSKVNAIGLLADQTATDSVNEGDIGIPRMTLDRVQIVTEAPSADTAGVTTFHLVSAATTNATNVKASAGKLHGWYIYNSNAAARKVAFHNTAGTPTAGASVFFSLVIPPTSAANIPPSGSGIAFSTGIAITMVTGLADSDATAVAANDLICNLFYI